MTSSAADALSAGMSMYSKLPLRSKDEASHVERARQDCANDIQRRRCPISGNGHVQQAAAAIHAGVQHALGVAIGSRVRQEVLRWAFGLIKHHLRAETQSEARSHNSTLTRDYIREHPSHDGLW